MVDETLERAERDLSGIVIDGVSLDMPEGNYLTSDEICTAIGQKRGSEASTWGRCVWSQCDYMRK